MEDDTIKNIIDATQELQDLVISEETNLEEIIEETTSDINLETEYPYLIFQTSDLIRAMNLCNKIVLPKSDNITYSSISLVPVLLHKSLYFYATNELSHFRFKTELLGSEEEMLNMNISIPMTILQKLVKLMGNKVLIYKKEDNLYIRLLDGDLLLDLREANMDILTFPGEVDKKIADLDCDSFGAVVNSMYPLLSSEVKGSSGKIAFTGEKAYYNSAFYYIESLIQTPKLALSARDSDFICKLYKYYKSKQIQLFEVKSSLNRLFLKLDNIDYEFINSTNTISNLMTEQMEPVIKEIESVVEYDRLYRTVNLATMLPSSTGNVALKYIENNLQASITSNKGDSDFRFTTEIGTDSLYKDTVLIRAETLRRLLSAFGQADRIGIALNDLGITLEYKGIKAILMNTEN